MTATAMDAVTRIAITGANGFVGRTLSRTLLQQGASVTGVVRASGSCEAGVDVIRIGAREFADSAATAQLEEAFRGCKTVVHLAARVHMFDDTAADPLAAFRVTNVEGSLRVAEAAQRAGARRLVFMSSIKALAESDSGRPLKESDVRRPMDAYGVSKAEAEAALLEFGASSGLEIVILRPPLVYGPQVRANFLRLLDLIAKGVPLPIGAVSARRSLCFVDNLASATALCAIHPMAAGNMFHVSDGEDPTVSQLARMLGKHLGRPARLLRVPVSLLEFGGRLMGRTSEIERLTKSLQLDCSHIRDVLKWQPPVLLDVGLAATADWYRSQHRNMRIA
ncbi:NAD-dependent epimerase/dehydratase family protein [Paraburkholderia domus]|uniref:NAD-dependent epimerase/dehydratase family protein n=1 Tax=Paraburkholderia domus TaxID=2793075 RepID=UPI0019127396|nr:NAD-dependent epimerase/dehydratase family protein [Paraburkholderia domus]MBK5059620.1 NAD-dependent epimerase/dehydratase family protein [Burkholderia sp. R-70199]CAE6845239.1 2-alkyl-3-oxoalkanoate reductase [Paraburkholderia domus]